MAAPRPIRACLALVLALPLAACSGSPFGEQLSDSFSDPAAREEPQAGEPQTGDQPGGTAPASPPAAATPAAPTASPAPPAVPSPAVSRPAALAPAPYRLILRLPAADPAAPAEAVTEALRAAGVSFEVETIERVPAAAPLAPVPSAQPAPDPR
jgi:hypothetical protein